MQNHAGKVAFVTGGDKGIGREIVRKLSAAGATVVLASQKRDLGDAAAREMGSTVECVQLELCDPNSIVAARKFVADKYGKLDILVNNAAVCFNDPTLYGQCEYTPFEKQAAITVRTNFTGTLEVTRQFLPLLRASASPRIIFIASHAGRLAILRSQGLLNNFISPTLKIGQLEQLMGQFVSDVEGGTHASKGWPNTCYGMSKLGLIALGNVLAREEPNIKTSCVDPGYCCTDQNANQGPRPAEHGARTPVFLALQPDDNAVSGKYWMDGRLKSW